MQQVKSTKEKTDFWEKNLKGIAPLQLPTDFSKTQVALQDYSIEKVAIEKSFTDEIYNLLSNNGTTLFNIFSTALNVVLYRYANQNEICFTSIIRKFDEKKGINVEQFFPFLSIFSGKTIGSELLQITNESLQVSIENFLTEKNLFNEIEFKQGTSIKQLLQVLFIFESEVSGKSLVPEKSVLEKFNTELVFVVKNTNDNFEIDITYNSGIFKETTVKSIGEHFKNLFIDFIRNINNAVGSLKMLSQDEIQRILIEFNNTEIYYPKEKTLVNIFEEQVNRTPKNAALIQYNQELSYEQLNARANRLAHYLIQRGVKPADNIGLISARSFDMIIGMLGIIKAGGAYVPIDPEYPVDRQEYILRQSSVSFAITDTDYPISNIVSDVKFVNINKLDFNEFKDKNPDVQIDSKQLAYTIYTSGSTGRPKGVMIEHHSAVNLVLWVNNTYKVCEKDRLLFITSMCFDLSVYDIFGILSSGGSLVIANSQEVRDVKKLPELLEQYKITFWDSVPTTLDYVVRGLESKRNDYSLSSLRVVFMSGDWIPVNLPDRILKFFPNTQVISLGGATEATVWSNFFPVKKVENSWKSIPYGKPISNNTFYILNEQLQPMPYNVNGELYIGGVGVARGYANDKEKTDYSFVNDPFNDRFGGKMYRTGDLGRMMPDGNMEFIGRKDNQVKIRGFRVELGEIESVILQSGKVQHVVVIASKDKEGVNRLVGYVVAQPVFDRDAIVNYIKSKLPDYMLPAIWVELEALPLTSNGKIDKKALPEPNISEQLKNDYAAPTTITETNLAAIWQDVLGVKTIGIDDNFFDLGGQSLLAVQLMNEAEEKMNKKFNIYTLFKYPTIRELSTFLEKDSTESNEKVWKSLVPIKATGKKMPIYVVHGDGMNVVNFNNLSQFLDEEQPFYSLQPKGLNTDDDPSDNLVEIAKEYVAEIIDQNPTGPYALAGYSFGGYVAIEMRNQMELLGKEVKLLGIFDTDAQNAEYNKGWLAKLPKRIIRQFPKALFLMESVITHPLRTHNYQIAVLNRKIDKYLYKFGFKTKPVLEGFEAKMDLINRKHLIAYKNYRLEPFKGKVHLFKAKTRIYFVDDFKFLGWKKYALKGVKVYDVPGDHKTMFLLPNVIELSKQLQSALDNC